MRPGKIVLGLVLAVVVALLMFRFMDASRMKNPAIRPLPYAQVTRVEVTSSMATTVLDRAGQDWKVTSLFDYPATSGRVERLIAEFNGLETFIPVNPDQTIQYETVVRFLTDNGRVVEQFALADVPEGDSDGRSIRMGNQSQWKVPEFFDGVSARPQDWVSRTLIGLSPGGIDRISIIGAHAEYTIQQINDTYSIVGMPEEATINQLMAKRMFGLFENLQFESIIDPGLSDDEVGLGDHDLVTVRARNGFVYELQVGRSVTNFPTRAVRLRVSYVGAAEPTMMDADIQTKREFIPSETDGSSEEARNNFRDNKFRELTQAYQKNRHENETAAALVTAALDPWRFSLTSSMVEQMTPSPSRLSAP